MKKEQRLLREKQRELLREIEQTKRALQTTLSNLEYITDPDLIDCNIYALKSTQVRYKYLLQQARYYNLTCYEDASYLLDVV